MAESEEALAGNVEIHACTSAERPRQAALYDRCFASQDGERVLPWRYDANPHGAALTFLASTPEGVAVSGYACSPRIVLAHGEEMGRALVGQTGDVMTDPEHRRMGIFSHLDRRAMAATGEAGWPVVFGLPNRQSAHIFVDQLGWKEVGRIRPFTFVLHPDAAARAERMRAGRAASAGVPWSYWRGTMRRGKLRNLSFDKVNVVAMPRFQPEVDDVARRVAADWPWMVRRDHEYLNWRFCDAPSGRFRAHGVFEPSGSLVGYAVLQLPQDGGSVGFVVDALAVDEAALAAALEAVLGHLRKAGASVARAHAMEGSWWERKLRWAGFRPGKRDDFKSVIAYVSDVEHPLAKTALDPASWYFTDGDRDDELVR